MQQDQPGRAERGKDLFHVEDFSLRQMYGPTDASCSLWCIDSKLRRVDQVVIIIR